VYGQLDFLVSLFRRGDESEGSEALMLYDNVAAMSDRGMSLRAIAAALNEAGQTTRRGKSWSAVQVSRVLKRAAA
jgi:hypothetical protein